MEELNVFQVLTDLGYKLKDHGKEYRARPLYRDSDNDTVLKIEKNSGNWFDFKQNISGDLNYLVKLTLKLDGVDEAKQWLKNKNFISQLPTNVEKPLIKSTKNFDINILDRLESCHDYWINRNITQETVSQFKGGIAKAGKMKNRYVFPIFNLKNNIIGFSGRDVTNISKIKWKHLGEKSDFLYPLFLNHSILQEQREVILVESVGDMLNLWQNGIKNVLVTFGTSLSLPILNQMLKLDIKKIYISLNNDSNKNMAGNIGADKIHTRLKRYFDQRQLKIALPIKKDFGEMTRQEILQWKKAL
jgi:5S rRNA maturation endonuclease (ribonuclease M5)